MRPSGPIPANIAIVGEAPGVEEERYGEPFIGASGRLLTDALHAAGLMRASCFITNVCRVRPPNNDIGEWFSENKNPPQPNWVQHQGRWCHPNILSGLDQLERELAAVQPRLVIALGNTALWALTGQWGVSKWRGSRLSPPHRPFTVVPSIHPAAVLRQLDQRPLLFLDFKRAKNIFEGTQLPRHYQFHLEPSFEVARHRLLWLLERADSGPLVLAGDIETRAGTTACLGIAWSETEALCIPFLHVGSSPFYWPIDEEVVLRQLLAKLFLHPNIEWVGQNYLYDCQYFIREGLPVPPRVFDTMIGHHSCFSTMRKGLDFLSAMYAHDHVYWKDESKNWDVALGEKQLWTYNCKDACITLEVAGEIKKQQAQLGNMAHHEFQQSLFHPVLRMMKRGVRLDYGKRTELRKSLVLASIERQDLLNYMAGHPLNPKSPKQLLAFFYNDLRLPGIKHLTTDALTTNSAALEAIANREPLLSPLCQCIAELRSIGVFLSTFIEAEPDVDGRMRSEFAVAGPTTYRFASRENAFGSGMNFQNLPTAEKQKISSARNYIKLPNIRELFIPDEGYTFFDMDLDRADLQVVVWEADDKPLKQVLREGLDMHCVSACDIYDIKGIPFEELKDSHPNYHEHRGRINEVRRGKAKAGVHAVDYVCQPRKLAQLLGMTVHEAERFIHKWFGAHPGIREWHKRTEAFASKHGYIENRFGARLYVFGRLELPELVAWQPQSTVAGVINRALVAIDAAERRGDCRVQLLIQVHDSLAGQFPTSETEASIALLRKLAAIPIPYPDPLIIPTGINTSTVSWGKCK